MTLSFPHTHALYTHHHTHTHTHTQDSASKSGGHESLKLSRGENELRKCLGIDTKESLVKSELRDQSLTAKRAFTVHLVC